MPYLLNSESKILVYHYGGRQSGIRARNGGGAQDFFKIRKECLKQGKLFEDPEFPAEDSSVFFKESSSLRESFDGSEIHWRRPHELCKDPQFMVDDGSRFDVQQGRLGNCWMVSAVAALPLNPCIFRQVVPEDNENFQTTSKNGSRYCGLFHFRIWQYGRWVDVVVDDRLPTDDYGQLIFMHSAEKNEFWSSLIEKCYAKLHGSYEALSGGLSYEALEDFTGGVAQVIMASSEMPFDPKVFDVVLRAHQRNALLACSTPNAVDGTIEGQGPKGLVLGHAYSVTDCKSVDIPTPGGVTKMSLLRVRNPWGQESEWEGDWSDSSLIWKFIPENVKEELGLTFNPDGEFWVSFEDFSKHFETLEIVYLSPDSIDFDEEGLRGKKSFRTSFFEGAWVRGLTAGGPISDPVKFALNPQYIIELEEPVDEDEDCHVIIALMQKNRRSRKELWGSNDLLTIRFDIFKIEKPDKMPQPLPASFFQANNPCRELEFCGGLREVSDLLELKKGTYCIVASLDEVDLEGQFILRVFSEAKNNLRANEETDVKLGGIEMKVASNENSVLTLNKKLDTERGESKSFINSFFNMMICFDPCVQVTDIDRQDSATSARIPSDLYSRIKTYFKTIAGDMTEVNSIQLSKILDLGFKSEFQLDGLSEEVCRTLIALEDVNKTGTLDIDEFIQLWMRLSIWIMWFKEYDKDNSGYLDSSELRQSLAAAGHYIPTKILQAFVVGCGDEDRRISFKVLTAFMLKLKGMTEIFQDHDLEDSGKAIFTLDQWLEFALLMS